MALFFLVELKGHKSNYFEADFLIINELLLNEVSEQET